MAVPGIEQELAHSSLDNRREPRVSYRLDMSADGVDVYSTNISRHGAQLCCPAMRYPRIGKSNDEKVLKLRWNLPNSGQEIIVQSAVRYANACDDEILIGVEFIEIDHQHARDWYDFVERLTTQRQPA